jgi:hypothetical protein
MLDGKRYFAEFPDEEPGRRHLLLRSARLLATLRALEKELRASIPPALATRMDAGDAKS